MEHGRFCRLYRIWSDMRIRCNNPNSVNYPWYGAKGVRVCAEWDDYGVFRAWAVSHGYAKGLTLDRIESAGNYEPNNCRWATRLEQMMNCSMTKWITFNGETLPGPVWAKRIGMHPQMLRSRINGGWSIEQALTIPVGEYRPGHRRGRKHKSEAVHAN